MWTHSIHRSSIFKLLDVLPTTTTISSSSSMLQDVASFTSSLFKTIKSTPFFKIFSLCDVSHFQPFFSLDVEKLKLFANCFVSSSIAFKCMHPEKVVLLSSLFIACLFNHFFEGSLAE
jgi:hypothetical protein